MLALTDSIGTLVLSLSDQNGQEVKVIRKHTMGQTWFLVHSALDGVEAEGWYSEREAIAAAKRMAA